MTDPVPHAHLDLVEGVTVVRIRGDRRLSESDFLEIGDALLVLIDDPGHRRLVLDFELVPFISSATLGKLVSLNKALTRRGGRLRLCGLQPVLLEVLRITRLDSVLIIEPDVDAARAALRPQ